MLKYISDGRAIPGVPARDLSEEEVKGIELVFTSEKGREIRLKGEEALLRTGLYEKAKGVKRTEEKEGDK